MLCIMKVFVCLYFCFCSVSSLSVCHFLCVSMYLPCLIYTVDYKASNHIYWKWVHGKDLRDFLNNKMPELGDGNNHFD